MIKTETKYYEYKGNRYKIITSKSFFKQKDKEDIETVNYQIAGDSISYNSPVQEFNELFIEVQNDKPIQP